MADASPKKELSTTPADLSKGIEAALDRCFGGLDEADEGRRLGVPEHVIHALRQGLMDLRDVAARARD